MPINDAHNFVAKMRENREFREKVLQTKTIDDLTLLLREEELLFNLRELAGAMAECMVQMERQMENVPHS